MVQPLRTIPVPEKLERLESFIQNLPNTLPVQPIEQSKYAMLTNLTLPAELVEDKGEPGASVLPNSMPDERTVSEFTRQNSALRGNQSVSTLVDIVQVGQWYKVHSPRIAGEPVKPPRRPVVKFRDMTRELQNGGEVDSDRDEDSSDEEDVAECRVLDWEVSDTAFALDEDIDLAAPVLRDMISETGPPIGEQSNVKGKASSTTFQSSSKPDVPDYDF
ncbi:hypothetical protein C8J55DRAFT_517339 [Lentinula edodes]|uniref:Uncharacterized protein n=1 Tax=Lentinula lateritia TaxID=40482 RepID=A0A9W9DLC8_9AGAR|nr:hypothetical protein C8J55DRAFT_517339 [Lentinula edodes]